jgi:hypothetical protein
MEFDEAFHPSKGKEPVGNDLMKPEVLKAMCKKAGLAEVPLIAFWNVRGSGRVSFPAGADTENVVLLSGDNDGIFQAFLSADFSDVSPASFMHRALYGIPYKISPLWIID